MELTPELLVNKVEFRTTFRGYDPGEVDDFLDRIAGAVTELRSQLSDALDRAQTAEEITDRARTGTGAAAAAPPDGAAGEEPVQAAHRMLRLAQVTADAALAEAHEEAERELTEAREQSARERDETRYAAERQLAEARATAERLTTDAASAADRREREVDAELRRRDAEARQGLDEALAELERKRDAVAADIELLDRHLISHRLGLRHTLEGLQRALEHPDSLRMPMPEGLSGVTTPTATPQELSGPDVTGPVVVGAGDDRPEGPGGPTAPVGARADGVIEDLDVVIDLTHRPDRSTEASPIAMRVDGPPPQLDAAPASGGDDRLASGVRQTVGNDRSTGSVPGHDR